MIEAELTKISETTDRAIELIEKGSFARARKLVYPLRHSFCITESQRAITLIEAIVLVRRNKKTRARELIYRQNYPAWGCPDLKAVLRLCNPASDEQTRLHKITIKGGRATFGAFTQFSDEHYCQFRVLANSPSEAMEYISRLCQFANPTGVEIISHGSEAAPAEQKHRGILYNSPFSLIAEPEQDLATH